MDFEDFQENTNFTYICLPKVAEDSRVCSIVKATALRLMNNPYMTLKEFFNGLCDDDISLLSSYVEKSSFHDDESSTRNLLLLSEMLSVAEGSIRQFSTTVSSQQLNYFCTIVTCVSLERKGLVEVAHDYLTFGTEFSNVEIVKLKKS